MKIISLRIKNNFLGWDFDEVDFSSNLTLLVGVSGAGKTQILRAMLNLKDIANGEAINGFEWKIKFCTINGSEFIWEGRFNTLEYETDEIIFVEKEPPSLLYEKLTSKNDILIERSQEKIKFKNQEMPKLSSHQSMIYILNEESLIKEAYNDLNKIEDSDYTIKNQMLNRLLLNEPLQSLQEKYKTLEDIVNSSENIYVKLHLVYAKKLDVFNKIKSIFIDNFNQVEDMKIEILHDTYAQIDIFSYPSIFIKEKSVTKWIKDNRMSSGMLKTFIHISKIYLSSPGTVILIDEFENSLGINCIDILTDDLIHENKNLQFIATSHHPYIINNIPYEYWKIVTRKGGHISIRDASDYHLGKSKQEAFLQLTKILGKQS
ncbi:AAA family ATPase [Dolichospermum heterosporum]|uniref:AAA family ATPase n=1 Tax=Dolichospermum heterosporum TAC447 TaxID=747523 RepID=A0ABY5LTG3_9CYAN|nr:AAA family ATPase [Dolichospermum heterosporum]UUO13843.1 AAA family ATPase [Dolichospermum heterosporum TAC447]